MSPATTRFLDLRATGPVSFSSATHSFGSDVVFGGEIFATCLAVAARTVSTLLTPVTLSAHLVRGGIAGEDIHFEVEAVHDGRNSAVRRLTVVQEKRGQLATSTVTFRAPTDGADRSEAATRVLSPPASAGPSPFSDLWSMGQFEFSHPGAEAGKVGLDHIHPVWVRPKSTSIASSSGPELVAFISDMGVVLQAAGRGELRHSVVSTAEHTLWLHRTIDAGDWLLLDARLRNRVGALATVAIELRDSSGELIADAVQSVVVHRARC